ncbi:MAG TPA: tail fiber domain-containing protein [Allosphingosinicella sp.]|jgi:hypothetical protein
MINFVDAGGQPNNPSAAAANLALIHTLIANTSVANPGGHDYWGAGPHIYFPPGNYHFSGPIRIRKAVRLEGSSAATRANYNTIFSFPVNSQGLVLDSFDTDNLSYLSYANRQTTGAGTRIEGIYFRGSNNALNNAHGVLIRAFVMMRDVHVTGFGGHGIYIKADLSENNGGQASNSQLYDCGAVGNNRSGLVIEGGDANIVQVIGGDYSFNGDWGVADLSFLGCTFSGIHATQNGQPNAGHRGTTEVSLVTYPGGSGQVWAIRANSAASGLSTEPGTNEMVWTRYHGQLSWTPPTWTVNNSGNLIIRPGGPYLTASIVAWSVWTGCYSEGNQPPSQMSHRAIVIGGDHGSSIQAVDNSGTGQPIWLDAHNAELDLKTNLRVKGLLLGQKRARPNDSVGMKMSAASAAPVSGTLYNVAPFMDYSWSPGDIVWNQDRSATQSGVTPPLGWRCTAGPDSFEEIPFPTSSSIGANPTFTTVTANQFIVPSQGSISGTGGELYVRGGWVRITNAAATQTYGLFTGSTLQLPGLATTASGANAFLDAGLSNALYRSTSSLRYKTDVKDVDGKYLDKLLDLRPVRYRSTAEADDPSLSHFGLIAEEVAEIEPRLVNFTYADEDYEEVAVTAEDGEGGPRTERRLREGAERKVPDGVQYDRLTVLLLGLAKRQQGRIEALEGRLADLAERLPATDAEARPKRS